MEDKPLQGKLIAILAGDMVEESELVQPRKALEKAGAETVLISQNDDEITSANHFDKSKSYKVDLHLSDAKPEDYDAVLLPGGALNADLLRIESDAQEFVRQIDSANKPIAVICHGPWLLVSAGLLKGRHITSFYTIADDIRNAGAEWSDEEVVEDRNLVSSRKPDDIPAFNEAMIRLFAGSRVTSSQ